MQKTTYDYQIKNLNIRNIAIRRLIEGIKIINIQSIITFVDLNLLIRAIKSHTSYKIHTNSKAQVTTSNEKTKTVRIQNGVLQGDTLAVGFIGM